MLYIWPWHAPELPPERLISSMITDASASVSPEPPYCSGISAASQPASVSALTNASGIAARFVHLLPVGAVVLRAQRAQRFAHLGVLIGRMGNFAH